MTGAQISAVVVAWNSGESLVVCLEALRESAARAGASVELVVVDNGSSDDSASRARASGAHVLVRNPVNAGYGVAAAQGIARASAGWILLLNPDVVVARDFVHQMLQTASSAPTDVASLVPDLRFASDTAVVNCRGVEVDSVGIPAEIEAGWAASTIVKPREIFGGSSGACLLRVEALQGLGGLEPAFFAYLEDVDLAWRLQGAGYRALLVPGAVAYHEGSASAGEGSPLKAFLVARNRRILFRLNGPPGLRVRAWRTLIELGHAVITSAGGTGTAPWRGRLDALRLRRYTGFVRTSRELTGPLTAKRTLAPRAGLLETLRRKRAVSREMRRHT